MSANFEAKKVVVQEIIDKIKASKSVVLVDYKSLTVAEVSEMRNKCKKANCEYKVYKNTLVRKAFNELGFDMFDAMIESIREDTVKMMFTIRLRTNEEPKREQVAKPAQESRGESDGTLENRPRTVKKVGRNDPCPCGSGKKYKKCCGRDAE